MNAECNGLAFGLNQLASHDRALLERIYTLARKIEVLNRSRKDWHLSEILEEYDPKELQSFGQTSQASTTSPAHAKAIEDFRSGLLTIFLGWANLAFLPNAPAEHKDTCAAYAQRISNLISAAFIGDTQQACSKVTAQT